MTEHELLKKILEDMEFSTAKTRANAGSLKSRDCVEDCYTHHGRCLAAADTDIEKIACHSALRRCLDNCPG